MTAARAAPEQSECVDKVLRALPGGAVWTGKEWRGRCPAHDDRTPSLTIREGDDGRALLYCHALCDTADIIAKIGLKWPDLYPQGATTERPRIVVARYVYCDERGEPLYRVVRSDPKSFRLESFKGEGWQQGRDCMRGVRRVLYRLPEVLAAVAAGEPIYVTEGEKDADLVAARGECATTNAGGAGKWPTIPDAQELLRGSHVFVVADRDRAGWRHALEVTEALSRAARVTVVASAVGKDFGDHNAAGYGIDDLVVVDPELEIAGLEIEQEADVTYARIPRAICRNPRLDDPCVRLFAVVDEMPGRTMSGRNFVAKALGWKKPAKVTEHAKHLVAAGFFHVTEHPSGDGHQATPYRAVNNPAREGSGSDSPHLRAQVGQIRPTRDSTVGPNPLHPHSLSESECASVRFVSEREWSFDFAGARFFDDPELIDRMPESDHNFDDEPSST